MEEQLEMEGVKRRQSPAEESENRKQKKRIALYVGTTIVHWIILLICLILFGLSHFRSPDSQVQWIYVKSNNRSITQRKPISLKKDSGTMEVNLVNHSIPIHCDGLYLFFLKGSITLQGNKVPLSLLVYHQPGSPFLKINCSNPKTEVQEIFVREFRRTHEVSFKYSRSKEDNETFKHDLVLNLIMLTPRSYCYPEK